MGGCGRRGGGEREVVSERSLCRRPKDINLVAKSADRVQKKRNVSQVNKYFWKVPWEKLKGSNNNSMLSFQNLLDYLSYGTVLAF